MKFGLTFNLLLFLCACRGFCTAAEITAAFTEPVGKLALPQALALAEERHPELSAARYEKQAAGDRITQAAAVPNPALSFEAENFGGSGEQRHFKAAEYTAQLEQTLELGGKRSKRIRVATAEDQLSGFDLEAARLDLRAETIRRFVGVLGAQAQADLAQETLTLADNFVQAVAARVGSGKVSPMELEKAQILLAQKKIAHDQARQTLATARMQLSAQWGSVLPAFECAVGDLPVLPAAPPPLSDLLLCLPGNPEVARWAGELERSRAILAQERAARVPDLTVAAGVRRANATDDYTLVAGVSVPLPIFDRNDGKIKEAEALLARAEQQRRAAEVKAAAALAASHQVLSTAIKRVTALKGDVLPRVKTVFDTVQNGYAQGKYSYLDVLEAQRTLVETRAEYIEALVSAHTGSADLERIVGGQLLPLK